MSKKSLIAFTIFASSVSANAATYLDQFVLFNGVNTFTDTFSDGLEPPAGPNTTSDYVTWGYLWGDSRKRWPT